MIIPLIAAFLSSTVALNCYDYSCESLDGDICALKHSATSIYITDGSCDCEISAYTLGLLASQDTGASIECSSNEDYSVSHAIADGASYDNYQCGTREDNVELASGDYPKVCADYNDCLLSNSDYNLCDCAYDGKSYCVPDISSSEYDDLWDGCASFNGNEILYWVYYNSIYPVQVNPPSCAVNVVYELITLNALEYESAAAALVLSVIGTCAVLC